MLDTPYYLDDFNQVIASVERLYAKLLSPEELAHIEGLRGLTLPARALYARLVNRRGPFFRTARLAYPEIGEIAAAIDELAERRFLRVCAGPPPDAQARRLLACFTLAELRASLDAAAAPRRAGRAALLDWLTAWENRHSWMAELLRSERLVTLCEEDPWPFLRFLFFGELRDNLSDFVIRALGHVATETTAAEGLRPCFGSRAQAVDAYRMAGLYRRFQEIRDDLSAGELADWWRSEGITRERLQAGQDCFDRLVDRLGRRLERERLAAEALALYATSPVAPARERRARLLLRQGRRAEAETLLQAILAAPCHSREAYAARQLLARVQKRSRCGEAHLLQKIQPAITLHYAPRNPGSPAKAPFAPTVEAAVLAHYRAQGWQGVHSENWLWNASFGLLLWDIIYDAAHGGFHSPLQFAPSDLHLPEFYSRRQREIEARLLSLGQPEHAFARMTGNLAAKQGLANPFVAWHDGLAEVLAALLNRVPAQAHAAVLRRMAQNFRHHAHGFPDLFIWNDGDYRFIEVKSGKDRLAAQQYEWLRCFAEAGIRIALQTVRPLPEAAG